MASPSTRQQLIDYCLRQLGHPVIEINVDDDQIEDRVDEAIQFYRDFHYDATEKIYKSVLIEGSLIQITGVNAASFSNGSKITGSTSGATAIVSSNVSANRMKVYDVNGTFSPGETITGDASATLSSITLGNYDSKYITLDDSIMGVERILQLSNKTSGMGMFDVRYQLLLNNIQSLTNTDIIYYSQLKTHLNLINDLMTGQKPIRFNRHMNRLFVDMDWRYDVKIGDYIIVEGWQFLDPDTYTDVYNDGFVKRLTTALIKRQWGNNLKKFEGVQMPGGVTLNGQKIFDEAMEEISAIKEECKNTYQLPVDFFTG